MTPGEAILGIGARLVWEPWRLHRLYPHVLHLLTDRRSLVVDRRHGPLREIDLGEIRVMKTFSPFGRLTVWRRGFVAGTGRRARVRGVDGVAGVEPVARRISARTGVPVGLGAAARSGTSAW